MVIDFAVVWALVEGEEEPVEFVILELSVSLL